MTLTMRRRTPRRIAADLLRWSLTLLLAISIGLLIASRWWMVSMQFRSGFLVEVIGGRVEIARAAGSASPYFSVTRHFDRMRHEPRWIGGGNGWRGPWSVKLPLYMPAAAFLIPAAWLWRARMRDRPRPGCCPTCGYDLRGVRRDAARPTCPECGAAIAASMS